MATEIEMAAARRKIVEITYVYESGPELDGGWIDGGWLNGKVLLVNGRVLWTGGGWVDPARLVEPYNYRDAGDVDYLADELGLDVEDTMRLLRETCPAEYAPPTSGDT